MTKELRDEIAYKNKLLKCKISHPTENNITNYKMANQQLQHKLKDAENNYYLMLLNNKFTSNHSFWKQFRTILNPNKRKGMNPIDKIFYDGKMLHNQADISNAFNSYFTEIGRTLNNTFEKMRITKDT